MDPALALPSYRVYRGSLAALLIGSIFAIWLLVLPQAGADRDAPPSSLAGVLPTRSVGTATTSPTATPTATADPAGSASPSVTAPAATATPAPPTPTATASASETTAYTIQPGDTLYAIAERFLPAGRDLDRFMTEIQTLNQITDPGSLLVGDVVQVPVR
ncbi:MAG: LysM domain-containing protein [Chloroflexi bacterium]|nr:LysM domain-containing protein [Chloroflexota bacterium]MDA1003343.1 LysM domain-containing protein [Chloroflexota bacterium]MQC27777.1 LysM domain-containing protein [Chloroflexota bacterium]